MQQEDDMMETPNWPPGNSSGGDKISNDSHFDRRAPVNSKLLNDQGEEDSKEHWQSTVDSKGYRPQDPSGNFYQEKDNSHAQAINKTADYLAKRKQREANSIAKAANDKDRLMSQSQKNFASGGGAGGGENSNPNKMANTGGRRSSRDAGDVSFPSIN